MFCEAIVDVKDKNWILTMHKEMDVE